MKLSNIKQLFEGNISFQGFFSSIKGEVAEYCRLLKKSGSSVPIILDEDIDGFFVTLKDVKKLGLAYLNKEINNQELYYLADALTLSNKIAFESERLFEMLEQLTDAEINGNVNDKTVEAIISDI